MRHRANEEKINKRDPRSHGQVSAAARLLAMWAVVLLAWSPHPCDAASIEAALRFSISGRGCRQSRSLPGLEVSLGVMRWALCLAMTVGNRGGCGGGVDGRRYYLRDWNLKRNGRCRSGVVVVEVKRSTWGSAAGTRRGGVSQLRGEEMSYMDGSSGAGKRQSLMCHAVTHQIPYLQVHHIKVDRLLPRRSPTHTNHLPSRPRLRPSTTSPASPDNGCDTPTPESTNWHTRPTSTARLEPRQRAAAEPWLYRVDAGCIAREHSHAMNTSHIPSMHASGVGGGGGGLWLPIPAASPDPGRIALTRSPGVRKDYRRCKEPGRGKRVSVTAHCAFLTSSLFSSFSIPVDT